MKVALLSCIALVCAGFFLITPHHAEVATTVHEVLTSEVTYADVEELPEPVATTSAPANLLFVGDIMLARAVETRMKQLGINYPFDALMDTLASPDVTIGNFEGVVTKVHYPTPNYTFHFSVDPLYLAHLKTVGFDVLSLANNHTLDYGTTSLAYTRTLCVTNGLVCGGVPKGLTDVSTHVVEAGTHRIGILFIHTLFGTPDSSTLRTATQELSTVSDIQVAYVHWGDEYVRTHNATQEVLAQTLIDGGIDAVVGHHPHVVQDVGLYNGKPIFYSLGNFIFDQFFSNDVQEMMGVHMKIEDRQIVYTLVPFSSVATHSQPRHGDEKTARALRERVLSTIREDSPVEVSQGTVTVQR